MAKWQENLHLAPGMRVGILGGSFDPPHAGHVHLSLEALKRFDLDLVVWLVSPGNPLKPNPPAKMQRRIAAARSLITHPRIRVSDFEMRHRTRFTHETLQALQTEWPACHFVWLMGADNLSQFHRWDNWRGIMQTVPVGVLARPGLRIAARNSVASRVFRASRLSGKQSRLLPIGPVPRWCFVNMPMRDISSSEIRNSGAWSREPDTKS
ncbi:putative nicotinate-nucleotide adenylyltransferase [Pelagimonas phthalicica]|uniref:Probable nicotinate-nucleotide adenylyltransferase n=1 Tax=Pelagimonas phthalicica TaxID=1037362 RepID=A0A238JJ57_9RHOB|nr:nicotinate-nucleotide adenylyltransferase [Pelagimonas phthalicica]TDS89804.1 nicotinate-nucleotide adenylyltransferase [Pelagimonas phthalicica]SMX29972.1 putative nicotinate-nucleotide adenylyltransferase [Pelagimonas phthalicica]